MPQRIMTVTFKSELPMEPPGRRHIRAYGPVSGAARSDEFLQENQTMSDCDPPVGIHRMEASPQAPQWLLNDRLCETTKHRSGWRRRFFREPGKGAARIRAITRQRIRARSIAASRSNPSKTRLGI